MSLDTKRMRACASLLPEPGGEVVCQCLDEIERLTDDYAAATHLLADRDAQIERLKAELATLRAAAASVQADQRAEIDAARALQGDDMSLPPLPLGAEYIAGDNKHFRRVCGTVIAYSDDELHAYAAAAAEAEREQCARICDTTPPYPFRASIEAAHAIRARSKAPAT